MWNWNGFQGKDRIQPFILLETHYSPFIAVAIWAEGHTLAMFSALPGTCPRPVSHPAPEKCIPPAWWTVWSLQLTRRSLWADCQIKVGPEWGAAKWAGQERRIDVEGERDAEQWGEMMNLSSHPLTTEHLLRTRHQICSGHCCCLPSI